MIRKEACAKCRACVAGLKGEEMFIEAENDCDAKPGDWVYIELSEDGFFNAVMIMYGFPLVGLLVGIFGGYSILPLFGVNGSIRDLLSFILGIVLTFLCYVVIRMNEPRWQKKKYRPRTVSVTQPDPSEN